MGAVNGVKYSYFKQRNWELLRRKSNNGFITIANVNNCNGHFKLKFRFKNLPPKCYGVALSIKEGIDSPI